MKKIVVVLAMISLTGCASIADKIPSRWDVNQAKVTTDMRQTAANFDCKGDQKTQLKDLALQVQWFDLYSESKGTKDVAKLTDALKSTIKEYQERVDKGPVSPLYCDIKKKLFVQQSDMIAHAVQGRF